MESRIAANTWADHGFTLCLKPRVLPLDQPPHQVLHRVLSFLMELLTNRFLLRDFTAADASAFVAYHADPRYARFYAAEVATPEHAAGLVRMFQDWATHQPRQNYQLAVVHREAPHRLVGCAGVRRTGLPPGHAELGMELAPEYWGRHAYAVEIGRAMLDFAFRELGVGVVSGSTVSANTRILRLAVWFGAEMVATSPVGKGLAARDWRNVEWRITRERWQHRASHLR